MTTDAGVAPRAPYFDLSKALQSFVRVLLNGLYRVAGADAATMEVATPAARAKFAALGLLVAVVFGVAWAGMTHMISQIQGFKEMAWRMGLVWGLFWGIIEVLIISSAKSYGVTLAQKLAAFALRAVLGLIPVLTFSTIWFIETNRPEIQVAIESIRIEREAKGIEQINATFGTASATKAAQDMNTELEAIRQKEKEVPVSVMVLSQKAASARNEVKAAEGRKATIGKSLDRYLSDQASTKSLEDVRNLASTLRQQLARATAEVKEKSATLNVLTDQVQNATNTYMADLATKRGRLESLLIDASSRARDVNAKFDARRNELTRATSQAAQENFSGLLAGMYQVLKDDLGKQIQFAFWFAALFLIECAAIAVKMFFVTDADVALAHSQAIKIARSEQAAKVQIARIEAESANAICQAQWERVAFNPEDRKMAAVITKLEAEARVKEKERNIALTAAISQATAPFEALQAYRDALHSNRASIERGSRRDASIVTELFTAAERTASEAFRQVISGKRLAKGQAV